MDYADRENIKSEIDTLVANQQDEKHLLLQSTSLIKSSVDLFSSTMEKVAKNEEQLTQSVKAILNEVVQTKTALTDIDYRVRINTNRVTTFELLSRVTSSMENFISDQKDLLQLFANLHHVPNLPVLIKPTTLATKLLAINNMLPEENSLPIAPTRSNLFWYYQQTSIDTVLIDNSLIVQLNIPITEALVFNTFFMFSVPIPVSGSVFQIIPLQFQAIAVNHRMNDYFMITKSDLSNCLSLPDQSKLCSILQIYNSQQHPNCEMQWLRKEPQDPQIPTLCVLKQVNISGVSIIETSEPNTWIFALPLMSTVTFLGPKGTQIQENLESSGVLTLTPGTIAMINGITIKAHPTLNSTVFANVTQSVPMKFRPLTHYTSLPPLSHSMIDHLPKLVPLWDTNKAGKIDLEASDLQNQISKIEIKEINRSLSFHSIIIYSILAIIIIFVWAYVTSPFWLRIVRNKWNYCNRSTQPNQTEPTTEQLLENDIQLEVVIEPVATSAEGVNLPAPYPQARYRL